MEATNGSDERERESDKSRGEAGGDLDIGFDRTKDRERHWFKAKFRIVAIGCFVAGAYAFSEFCKLVGHLLDVWERWRK